MTGLYDWNPMLAIRCPQCHKKAEFEFAEVVRMPLKKDIPFFLNNPLFDYQLFKDSCGHRWHGAVYFPGFHGSSTVAIRDLPEGYEIDYWGHSKYMFRAIKVEVHHLIGDC